MSQKNDDLLKHLLATFQTEAADYIQTINSSLLSIESAEDDEDVSQYVQNAFRAAHNLKGAARMVDLNDIETLAHTMENVLQASRDTELSLTADVCDVLYDALDALESRLGHNDVDLASIQDHLQALLPETSPQPQTSKIESEQVNNEITEKQTEVKPASPSTSEVTSPKRSENTSDTIRVTIEKLDDVMAEIGELQVSKINAEHRRSDLFTLEQQLDQWNRRWKEMQSLLWNENGTHSARLRDLTEEQNNGLQTLTQLIGNFTQSYNRDAMHLGLVTDELRDKVRRIRMLPFRTIVVGLERVVRDAAYLESKKVNFSIKGDDIELDKKILEIVKDPLMHLLRNAVSHGIESEAERLSMDKPKVGNVELTLEQRGSEVYITVSDDGQGFDTDALRQVYLEKFSHSDDTFDKVIDLAFLPGVSTAKVVTELSGRGVGLDIVRKQLEAIQGRIAVRNTPGQGVSIVMTVPTSLAVTRSLLIEIGDEKYAIPLLAIEKIVPADNITVVAGKYLLPIDNKHLPLVPLSSILKRPIGDSVENPKAIIIAIADTRLALQVDRVTAQEELAIKPLGDLLDHVPHVTGVALLGDGLPIIVLNPADIMRSAQNIGYHTIGAGNDTDTDEDRVIDVLVVDDSITTRTLEKNILEAEGFNVYTAVNGVEAIAQLKRIRVDIVISDVQMPEMDGIELTRTLRKDSNYSNLPIILVTSLESEEDRAFGLQAGANAYIVKRGFKQSELLDTIEKLI